MIVALRASSVARKKERGAAQHGEAQGFASHLPAPVVQIALLARLSKDLG